MPQGTRHLSVPSNNPFVSQIQERVLSSIMKRVSNKAGLLVRPRLVSHTAVFSC